MVSSAKAVVSRAKAYLKARQKNVRMALRQLKLDAMLLTHPPDLAYLSDFTGDDSIGLLTNEDFYLVTDGRFKEQGQLEAPWLKMVVREGKMPPELARTVISAGPPQRIGFEANFTTVGQVDALKRALEEAGAAQVELVPLENVMTNIRRFKDDREIELTRKSIEIAQEAFEAILPLVKVGQSEGYIAGSLVFEMHSRGASDASSGAVAQRRLRGGMAPSIRVRPPGS